MKQSILALSLLIFCSVDPSFSSESKIAEPNLPAEKILNKQDRSFLSRNKVIRKCVDPLWMPLEGINQSKQHVGVIADILKLVEQKIGVSIKLVPTKDWSESMEKLRSRECDIVTSDAEYGTSSDFYLKTDPIFNLKGVYITRNNTPLQMDFSLITDKRIGIPKGYPTIELIKNQYGKVNIIEVKDVDEGLLMVSRGELYAFTGLLPVCSYSIQRLGLTNLKVAGHLDVSLSTVMAIRSDMPELVDIFNKVFATIDQSVINQFLGQWIKVEYDMKFDWNKLVKYLLVVFVFFCLILYWNRRLYHLNRKLDKANAELAHLNETDTLTKMKNRNFLTNQLPKLVKIANRNSLSLSIAMIDIDHFKRLNDIYGHAIGDKCLIAFADKVHKAFRRESDWAIRYGGEEFVLVCIGMSMTEFVQSLDGLRREVETIAVLSESGEKAVFTVSAGYVFYPFAPKLWDESLIVEADKKLYQAKKTGRNQIVGSGDTRKG